MRQVRDGKQRGFSLVELMTVIAILGIAASLAVVAVKSDPTAKTARELAVFLQAARRGAVAHGAVRADVSAATGITATRRVRFLETAYGSKVELFELVEGTGPTATWVSNSWLWVPSRAKIYGVASTANSSGGETLPTAFAVNSQKDIFFYPNGSSDAATVYLQSRKGAKPDKFRVYLMPLSGMPMTTKGW